MSPSIVEFGRQVARALGSGTNAARLAKQEAAVVAYARERRRVGLTWPLTRWAMASILTASLVALAVYLGVRGPRGAEGLHQNSGGEATSADVAGRRWIALADGSRLGVDSDAEVQVLEQADVRVRLVTGQVNVQVTKQQGQDWVLVAGPYRVAVLGTRFDVAFDAQSEGFEVKVMEGLVRVFGGELPDEGLSLQEGQGYASGRGLEPSLVGPAPSDGSTVSRDPAAVVEQPTASVQAPTPQPLNVEANPDVGHESATPTWRPACAAGRYADAFAPGTIENLQALLEQSLEGELLQLANCLRYAGRSSEAGRALSKLRERFPGSPGAILASYHLARLFQREAKVEAAMQWFATYLTESPKGQLAASARAELVRLWVQQGNMARARAVARDYLRLHPAGSFAGQARELLDRAATPK